MAIEEKLGPEVGLLREIRNVDNCFSRMHKEKYDWKSIETNLNKTYDHLPKSVQDKYQVIYLNAMSLVENAKDFKSEK